MVHKAFTECFHFSRLAAIVLALFHNSHPASFLSFSTVRSQVVFGLPLLLFPSGAHVTAMLQLLFWSCLSICPIIIHLRRFTCLLIGFISALSSSSLVLTRSCHLICRILLKDLNIKQVKTGSVNCIQMRVIIVFLLLLLLLLFFFQIQWIAIFYRGAMSRYQGSHFQPIKSFRHWPNS